MVNIYPKVNMRTYHDTTLADTATTPIDTIACTDDEMILLTNLSCGLLANLFVRVQTNDGIDFELNLAEADNLTERGMPIKQLASKSITLTMRNATGGALTAGNPGKVIYRYEILPRTTIAKIFWNLTLAGNEDVPNTEAWLAKKYDLKNKIAIGVISARILIEPFTGGEIAPSG